MNRISLPILTLILLSIHALAQENTSAPATPAISSPEPIYDFGIATNLPSVTHTFILKNEGTAELVINNVKPSCGCTTASLAKKNLQPGEAVEVKATFDLKGRRGKQRKTITVTSNDPVTPRFLLQIVGTVHQEVNLLPRSAVFRYKPGTQPPARDVRIRFDTTQKVNITGIKTNRAACCSVSLATEVPGKEYKLTMKLRPDYSPSALRETAYVDVLTDLPSHPSIQIPIQIQVDRDIVVAPTQITLIPSKDVFSQQLLVRHKRSKKIEIVDLKSPFENMTYDAVKMSDSMYRINIKVLAPDQSMNGKSMRLHVKDAAGVEQIIKITVRVAAGVVSG